MSKTDATPAQQPTLAELRARAFGAWNDHQEDMKNDPEYRKEFERLQKKGKLK